MGLNVSVYRSPLGDGTNGGESSRYQQFCLINVEGPCKPNDDTPAAELVVKDFGGSIGKTLRIVPVSKQGKWVMFGGNFAFTSDSRFSEACDKLMKGAGGFAVKIFDRVE